MNAKQTGLLKALAFVLATLGATGLLVAAGLSEEPQPSAATACLENPACLRSTGDQGPLNRP